MLQLLAGPPMNHPGYSTVVLVKYWVDMLKDRLGMLKDQLDMSKDRLGMLNDQMHRLKVRLYMDCDLGDRAIELCPIRSDKSDELLEKSPRVRLEEHFHILVNQEVTRCRSNAVRPFYFAPQKRTWYLTSLLWKGYHV